MVRYQYIKENFVKNLIIVIIAALLWPIISSSVAQIKLEQTNDFLIIISILLVTVSFTNFAFTYEKSRLKNISGRLLAHIATGIFMLLIALLLESIVIVVKLVYPFFYAMIFSFALLLYIGIVLYDFWDMMRVKG